MINKLLGFFFLTVILACSTKGEQEIMSSNDSIKVFNSVLKSKSFLKGNIEFSDSLYFIKENKRINIPGKNEDKRERYEITKFAYKSDTVFINLFNPGVRESYSYKLINQSGFWKIINEEFLMY